MLLPATPSIPLSSPPFLGHWSVTWQNDAKRTIQKKTYIEEGRGECWTHCLLSCPWGVRMCNPPSTSVCDGTEHRQPGKFTVPRGFMVLYYMGMMDWIISWKVKFTEAELTSRSWKTQPSHSTVGASSVARLHLVIWLMQTIGGTTHYM